MKPHRPPSKKSRPMSRQIDLVPQNTLGYTAAAIVPPKATEGGAHVPQTAVLDLCRRCRRAACPGPNGSVAISLARGTSTDLSRRTHNLGVGSDEKREQRNYNISWSQKAM